MRIKKGIPVAFRGHLAALRFKDGFLGFAIADLHVSGRVDPTGSSRRRRKGLPKGARSSIPTERIVVVNLNGILPPELSVQVKDVVCENGEMRFIFGPSQYRLDKVIAEMGRDPFEDE